MNKVKQLYIPVGLSITLRICEKKQTIILRLKNITNGKKEFPKIALTIENVNYRGDSNLKVNSRSSETRLRDLTLLLRCIDFIHGKNFKI